MKGKSQKKTWGKILYKKIKFRDKKTFNILQVIFTVAVILFLWFVFSVFSDALAILKTDDTRIKVSVPQGATTYQIASVLAEKKIINYPFAYALYSKLSGDGGKEKFGDFIFSPNMSYGNINALLQKGASYQMNSNEVWVTIPEGYEAKQIIELLVSKGLGTKEEFMKAINQYDFEYSFVKDLKKGRAYRLEGYLMPDTYIFSKKEGGVSIINRMLENFNKKITPQMIERAKQLDLTLDKIIILSSIIEREAKVESERALISSVFYNRLKSKQYPYLESCATVQYILGERKPVLSTADTKINNPYNTYMFAGLTPGPISSPGIESINSALYPANTDYYFFVAKKDGSSLFAKTFEEHNKNIKIANS